MGSKNRISKYIVPLMTACRVPGQWWVEPFVGGGNIIDKVDGNRLGADINKYAIDALISIRDYIDNLPKTNAQFTENDYKELRKSDTYRHKGYAGFAFSYGGKWLGGWRRDKTGKRDYVAESFKNAVKQSPNLQNVRFIHSAYYDLQIPPHSLIYCDPPYKGTTGYNNTFDHELFWKWCVDRSKEGHIVFISEYNAPGEFSCIWEKGIVSSLTQDTGSKRGTEKLFIYRQNNRPKLIKRK